MRRLVSWLAVVLVVAGLTSACTPQPPVEQKADPSAIAAVIDSLNTAFAAAVAARDWKIVVDTFNSDRPIPGMP